jgi:hypothetical protein
MGVLGEAVKEMGSEGNVPLFFLSIVLQKPTMSMYHGTAGFGFLSTKSIFWNGEWRSKP